ncbi:class I SAM-dependent methyltransferase [bacterium]|nr:class I SAM-dependent methyltransferase [bacterium]
MKDESGDLKQQEMITKIKQYWNDHIHDLEIAQHSVGTEGFFQDLDEYRFDKLRYLPRVVDFSGYRGKKVLEIGCGVGLDLVRFARGDAWVTGVDLSETAIDLAKKNFKWNHLKADLRVMNGENLEFADHSFDVVYAHGVLQYTADTSRMIEEAYRVLKPGGTFIGMVYNRKGWLNIMSKFFKVGLEHEDAPVLKKYSIGEFKNMLSAFSDVQIVPERFPVQSRLHHGLKGFLFNSIFVGIFNRIPKPLVRKTGWHIMAIAFR